LIEGEVLLEGEAGPRAHDHAIGELARDLNRLVLRLGIDDDQLVRPGHALQAPAQVGRLVERDQGDRQARRRHAMRSRTAWRTAPTSIVATWPATPCRHRWPAP